MKAFKKTVLAATLLASLGFATSANAYIVDLFTDPTNPDNNTVRDTTVGNGVGSLLNPGFGTQVGNGWFNEYGSSTTILGGYRDLYVETMSTSSTATPISTMTAGGGELTFSNTAGVVGYGKIQWDGADSSADLALKGLNGAKMIHQDGCGPAGCSKLVASVLEADLGFEYKITVYDMDGSGAVLTANTVFPVATAYDSTYEFDWFNLADGNYVLDGLPFNITRTGNLGQINFDDVGALQLELNTGGSSTETVAVDLRLASVTKVPEPGALALVGIALAGLGLASKRRKTA